MASSDSPPQVSTGKWLALVGIGEDGVAGLGEAARRAIADAEFMFGSVRHLALAAELVQGESRRWPTPFDGAVQEVAALRGRRVCVLASGDPFNHGVGVSLARRISACEMQVWPAPSSFSLAAARLNWALQDVDCVSLHGRPIDLIRPLLHPGRRILALTSDGAAPAATGQALADAGFGASRVTVLENLGGPTETVSGHLARALSGRAFSPLNIMAVEVAADAQARILPFGFGLDDALFEHDGQITKREIRAATLAALSPRHGELLWDIGAGSGSISVEWMLAHPSLRAVAIEKDAERAGRITRNASRFGVPALRVVHGAAPEAMNGLPVPDAVFIGGGGSREPVAQAAMDALRPGGRLVANAVTLEMEAVLVDLYRRFSGELTRFAISRASAIGGLTGWQPARPVTQWSWVKP